MALVRAFLARLVALLRPERAERELTRELAAHLALIEEEYQRRGMPEDEARDAARRALGVEQAKEIHRDQRSFPCYIPARRATKVDPLVALRCE